MENYFGLGQVAQIHNRIPDDPPVLSCCFRFNRLRRPKGERGRFYRQKRRFSSALCHKQRAGWRHDYRYTLRISMKYLSLVALFALTACGADGAPNRPTPKPGVAVSGEAAVGVTIQ